FLDYRKLKDYVFLLYVFMLILLIGLFFTSSIQNVHRWYRLPGVPFALQPSEFAKLIVVITLSYFIEVKKNVIGDFSTCIQAGILVLIPFALILKQPDLGSALVLFPITLVMFYLGGIHAGVVKWMSFIGAVGVIFVSLIFSEVLKYEEVKPILTKVIKEYQAERFNPNTYHQKAGQTAIALGKFTGKGFQKGDFTKEKWLPFGYTDSVFSVFAEEFGVLGAWFLLSLYFALIYFSFQVTASACDEFGRLLSSGIAIYIAMHVVVNIGMMCGFLPITGVPLVMITYGGSSILATMSALGILQSIYSRRYMF
ncbi:MAG: FtsW/RodA/SpoVE family cell cycle protein, partial [Chlamydiae bacterium]|nr:FtsW/RodA/SpoVE family cell cycle protein [Chlamydiota bacterium]